MNFYPGSAFAGLALNAYPQPWRAWASKEPSGSTWFVIHLDAIGIYWEVDYVVWAKRCAFVATTDHHFYWPDGQPGLAARVLRPCTRTGCLEVHWQQSTAQTFYQAWLGIR